MSNKGCQMSNMRCAEMHAKKFIADEEAYKRIMEKIEKEYANYTVVGKRKIENHEWIADDKGNIIEFLDLYIVCIELHDN